MLHLIVGTMASAKSKTLLNYVDNFQAQNKKVTVYVPVCCQRKDGYVTSRNDERKAKAVKIFNINDLYNNIGDSDILLIDEIQFLCTANQIDYFMSFLEYVDRRDIDVYMFGLNLNYLSQPFELTQRLFPYVDTILNLNAKCDICGKPACRCLRYVNGELDVNPESSTLLLESENVVYKSLCRKHYREITGLNAIK